MSYTDDTVYRLRDVLEQYTDLALTHRNEVDKKEELLRLIQNNNLIIPEIDIKDDNTEVSDENADEIAILIGLCMCEYRDKKRSLQRVQQENKILETYLKRNKVATDELFINLSDIQANTK